MKRESSSYGFLLIALAMLLAPGVVTAQPNPPSTDLSFTILQLNDIYEIAPLRGSDEGGLARVATVRQQLLKENPNTITLLAGDFVSPSLIGTLSYRDPVTQQSRKIAGKQMVDVLNKMGLDYVTFGNHEFDIKMQDLQQRINESSFTWVNSNVFQKTPNGLSAFVKIQDGQADSIMPYAIRTFSFAGSGLDSGSSVSPRLLRVGIIGATIPFNKTDYNEYGDPYDSFIKAYDAIRSRCDVIIGITHLSRDMDSLLASRLPGLDLIVGGHEHTNMRFTVGHPVISKADANDKSVYIHRISYSPLTKKVTINSELKLINNSIPSDEAVNKSVQYWGALADSILIQMGYHPNEVLMTAGKPLDGRESMIRNGQTNYTRLIADALWHADTSVDVALYNSGSLRLDDELMGEVTEYDVLRSLPFGGAMAVMNLKGTTLDSVLNTGTQKNKNEGGYLQLRNAVHVGKNKQGRDKWLIKGNPLQGNKTYRVLMPEFVAMGKEKNLEFLRNYDYCKPSSFQHTHIRNDIRDIFIAYLKKAGQTTMGTPEGEPVKIRAILINP